MQGSAAAGREADVGDSALEAELLRVFPWISRVELATCARRPDVQLALVALRAPADARPTDLTRFAAARQRHLLPIFFRPAEWAQLGDPGPGGQSLRAQLVAGPWDFPPPRPEAALVQEFRRTGRDTTYCRRLTKDLIDNHLQIVASLRDSGLFSVHQALATMRDALAESFSWALAITGVVFDGGRESLAQIDNRLSPWLAPAHAPATLYLRLVAEASKSQLLYLFGSSSDCVPPDWGALVAASRQALTACRAYLQQTLLTERERRQHRRQRLIGWIGSASAILLALATWFVVTHPQAPIANFGSRAAKAGGIAVTFFRGIHLAEPLISRVDAKIDLRTARSVDPKVDADRFSARWSGFIKMPSEGSFFLCADYDDGGRVYFNGERIINDWNHGPSRRSCAKVRVREGWYPLRVELYDLTSVARMTLSYGAREAAVRVVPATHLCCQR